MFECRQLHCLRYDSIEKALLDRLIRWHVAILLHQLLDRVRGHARALLEERNLIRVHRVDHVALFLRQLAFRDRPIGTNGAGLMHQGESAFGDVGRLTGGGDDHGPARSVSINARLYLKLIGGVRDVGGYRLTSVNVAAVGKDLQGYPLALVNGQLRNDTRRSFAGDVFQQLDSRQVL